MYNNCGTLDIMSPVENICGTEDYHSINWNSTLVVSILISVTDCTKTVIIDAIRDNMGMNTLTFQTMHCKILSHQRAIRFSKLLCSYSSEVCFCYILAYCSVWDIFSILMFIQGEDSLSKLTEAKVNGS
jgi:hypothetical protein